MHKEHEQRIKDTNANRQRIKDEAAAAKEAIKIRGQEAVSMITESNSIDLMKTKLHEMTNAYLQEAQAGNLNKQQMAERAMQIRDYASKIAKLEQAQEETTSSLGKLKAGFKSFTSGLTGIFSKIKRIATTMLIRSAIRNLIKDIKEGITNVREWAKVNNHEFYKSMDGLKQKTTQLKNALGASFAPLIQALIPVLKSLSNAIIEVANWFNQLISLLTGKSTWIQAQEDIEGYTDDVENANKATKEWLASFDELNVMSKASGGSGGGNQPDYENMFQEIGLFDERIREIADFLKSNFEMLKVLAIDVGAAILAWKLSGAFAEAIPLLSTVFGYIATGAVIALTIGLNWMFANEYLETGKDGWLWAEVLSTAVGATAAWAMAAKLFGGHAGAYAASITLAFSAITGIVANVSNTDLDAFDAKSIKQNIIDALKAGSAVGILLVATGVASLPWALAAAGGVALLTFGLTLGIKLLTADDSIEWGDLKLTEEQIKEYASEKMFTTNISVLINQFEVTITKKKDLELAIQEKLADLETQYNILQLGIDKENTLNNIITLLGDEKQGLIKDVSDLCDLNISQMKLTFATFSIYDGAGNPMSADTLLAGVEGWHISI